MHYLFIEYNAITHLLSLISRMVCNDTCIVNMYMYYESAAYPTVECVFVCSRPVEHFDTVLSAHANNHIFLAVHGYAYWKVHAVVESRLGIIPSNRRHLVGSQH